ncbi:hypothetical protein LAC81_37535 (plasmid) [Ensifer adhaerens]|uniref:hypothetical protein n=1 Tax=Ensifer adhaerens TaxID=106592 RepID=UPI001CBFBCAA|nr:hypothetical protein [Ensifer adhaerens]MBZ7927644.1 hypothetical protein [Ensifer adhaerens]UAX98040.1 hypothetical protein LAC78_38835 [Ensifer adhaerens]UAY05421.1 hypothetical protein LAC80_37550 [Ensifer adhaerens]UAY12799.1 hypothetical protein LAC81_37535 [Ensifer adhaerens]
MVEAGSEIFDRQIGQAELEMLQRTFDRVCLWRNISKDTKRAERLARYLTGLFRNGICDEATLFENAMWLERPRSTIVPLRRGMPLRPLD